MIQGARQVPLAEAWNEDKDAIFKQWLQEMISPRDSARVVSFNNPALRDSLKEYFEKKHRFYLIDQFNIVQKQGILFHPSLTIAESANRIAIDMMANYPDEYDATWLVNVIVDLKERLDAETPGADNPALHLRRTPQRNIRWAYSRVSEFMNRMLEHSQVRDKVDSCLDRLIKVALHDWVLNIVKGLRFAPEFDGFYWMKRLLDQADEQTRDQTYHYLLSCLKKADADVYELLERVETWMPGEDRNPGNYSSANRVALRLLIQYFLETTAKFDHKYYGKWPSRYPLFELRHEAEATKAMALLTRWLFHPGLKHALPRSMGLEANPYSLIATMVAEWAFILLGPGGISNPNDGESDSSEGDIDALGLLELLLEQISIRIDAFQRSELLIYWDKLDRDLLKLIASYLRPDDQQKELKWKRGCVRELAAHFKGMTARPKAS